MGSGHLLVGQDDIGGRRSADLESGRADDEALGRLPPSVDLQAVKHVDGIGASVELRCLRVLDKGRAIVALANGCGTRDAGHGFRTLYHAARHQPAEILDQRLPPRVANVAGPVCQVVGMGQLKDDRQIAAFNDDRYELALAVRQGRLGPNPARPDRARRPQYDHGRRRPQLALDDLVEGLA